MRSFQDYLIIDGQAVPFEPNAVLDGASDTVFYAVETNVNVWGVRWKVYGVPIGPDAGFIERDYLVNGQTKRLKVWSVALNFGQHWVCMTGADTAFGDQVKFEYRQKPDAVTVNPAPGLVTSGTFQGKTFGPPLSGNTGIEVQGVGVTLKDIAFTDDYPGYLVKVAADNCTIDGMTGGKSKDYAIYAGTVSGLKVSRLKVIGCSTHESAVRLAGCIDATFTDVYLDYRPSPTKKASIRGYGSATFTNGTIFGDGGGTLGLTPMSYDDGGSGLIAGGYLCVNRPEGTITVSNKDEWIAAVQASIAAGKIHHAEILADVLNKVPAKWKKNNDAPEVIIPVSDVDQSRTVSERIRQLGQRAKVTFTNFTLNNTPIRNAAGGDQKYTGCTINTDKGEVFTQWNENEYPTKNRRLPKDVVRPAPVTVFERCQFNVSVMTRGDFLKFCGANNITLLSCGFNGVAIETSGVS